MKLTPRDQLFKQLSPQYTKAMNTAPVLRERIKLEDAQAHAMELERERQRGRLAAVKAKVDDEKDPNTPNAVVARLMKKMGYGEELIPTQQSIVKSHVETNFSRYEPEMQTKFKDESRSETKREDADAKATTWFAPDTDPEVLNTKANKRYLAKRDAYLRRAWPQLYKQEPIKFGNMPSGE